MPIRIFGGNKLRLGGGRGAFEMLDGGSPAAFKPSDISGLTVQLDASDASTMYTSEALTTLISADGEACGGIKDKTGNGHNPIHATADNRPLYKAAIQNGLSVLRFDGIDDFLKSAAFTVVKPETIFVVIIDRGLVTTRAIYDGNAKNNRQLYNASGKIYAYAGANPTGALSTSTNEEELFTTLFNGANSSVSKNAGAPVAGSVGNNNGSGLTLGALGDGTAPGQFDFCELLTYAGVLSVVDTKKVEKYLSDKWGLNLFPSGSFTYSSSIEA